MLDRPIAMDMLYDEKLINNIKDMLIKKNHTLSLAESVTSGHLQAAFSLAKDASQFLQGGITAYNGGQKCRHLDIEPIAGLNNDCVTEQVACEMALNVNKLFISNYGIAITGYASKMPEKGINDLHAFFAIAEKNKLLLCKKITAGKEGLEAQVDYTRQVIKEFANLLTGKATAQK
jgi:nicotinamide-nucleotide amidase